MPPERPALRGPRRTTAAPTKIPTGPPVGKFAPYLLAAVAIGGPLYVLVKVPRYASIGAMALIVVLAIGLGWMALAARPSLPPGDSLRNVLPLVAVIALGASIVPFAYTIFPPAPRGEVRLNAPGDSGSVEISGTSATAWITVAGRFVPNSTGNANYFLMVSHGNDSNRIDGTLRPHAGGPLPERHVLTMRGPGAYTVRLEQASSAVAMPLTVSVSAKPFSTWLLILFFGSIAVAVIAVDVMLFRRGVEPAFAASLLLPMVAAVYFQRNPGTNTLTTDLLAAGVIGLIGGGIGGEVIGRAVRGFTGGK